MFMWKTVKNLETVESLHWENGKYYIFPMKNIRRKMALWWYCCLLFWISECLILYCWYCFDPKETWFENKKGAYNNPAFSVLKHHFLLKQHIDHNIFETADWILGHLSALKIICNIEYLIIEWKNKYWFVRNLHWSAAMYF